MFRQTLTIGLLSLALAMPAQASDDWLRGLTGRGLPTPMTDRAPMLVADVEPTKVTELARPCAAVPALPVSLATISKYDQADSSRSSLSASATGRDAVLQPIRNAIRAVVSTQSYRCAVSTIAAWASAGALTDMDSEDAFLTRDRFISEIAMLLIEADDAGEFSSRDRATIEPWLSEISRATIEFYRYRAGPNSKLNNHRYWAGLSVGAIGYLLNDAVDRKWADRSFELGVCQVDDRGHLPLEMARGSQALNYHIYALRPLLAYAAIAERHGSKVDARCADGLSRLVAATRGGLADPVAFAKMVGKGQAALASEKSYSRRLQLTTLGLLI